MIGFVLNPIAGIGGLAGLAGSDGETVQRQARARGGEQRAAQRAGAALAALATAHPGLAVLTASGALGENAVRTSGLTPRVAYTAQHAVTTGEDTMCATEALAAAGAELILFTGGDGTARDVARGLPPGVAALGVPAGVKMYSECFALGPAAAGTIAATWVSEGGLPTRESEVLDLDEQNMRAGRPDPRLFALVPVPAVPGRTQARKAATPATEKASVHGAALELVAQLRPGVRYLLGPGGTLAEVARVLGVAASPLGVDIIQDGAVVVRDASERQTLTAVAGRAAKAIVTIIGGQGFLLGRGNQQLSARVIEALGENPLLVVATEQKMIDLSGRPLLVDTGDAALDARLAGHVRVITGPHASSFYPVSAASAAASFGAPHAGAHHTKGATPCG